VSERLRAALSNARKRSFGKGPCRGKAPYAPATAPEEVAIFIMAIHQTPSLTQERYEEVVRRLAGKSRLESPSDLPFDGLLVHIAGQSRNGFCVVDVFESEEAVDRFNNAMGSIPREVGIEQPPEFFPAHTFISE
jgi:hypothetical protein